MTKTNEVKREAIKYLKSLLKSKNKTIFTIVRHVSQSGMQRRISCFVAVKGSIQCIDWYIEQLGLYKRHKNKEGLVVNGCGMDMGFSVVYNTSSQLYEGQERAGYIINQRWL